MRLQIGKGTAALLPLRAAIGLLLFIRLAQKLLDTVIGAAAIPAGERSLSADGAGAITAHQRG